MFMPICSLLLLVAATHAEPKPVAPRNQALYNKLISVAPDEWALHDWVPEKNRVVNAKGLPVGKGELEGMLNPRRRDHNRPQHGKQRQHRRHRPRPDNYKDLLKKHILANREHVMQDKESSKIVRARPHHGKHKKHGGKVRRRLSSRVKKRDINLFPRDLRPSEEAKLRLNSDICSQTSMSDKQLFLMPWWHYYCNPFEDKNPMKNFHGKVYMPQYRQVVDNLQKYKKLMDERSRVKDLMLKLKVK
ncbi:hypothetical protein O0L34_g17041 [Tuta absoluta]|nr:hypothetical protein O0L34_g17041 [Tuta absoluta]